MKDQEPIGKRLEKLIYHYRLNKYSFSQRIESSSSIISRVIAEPDRSLSLELIQRIAENFPDVSIEWLVMGDGPMLKQSRDAITPYPPIKHYKKSLNVPAGIVFAEGYEDCDAAFDVYGDAMAPRYYPGDIVIAKKVTKITAGQPHLLVADELPLIRIITKLQDGMLTLKAENPKYDEIKIPLNDLKLLYVIKGVVRRESF